MRRHQLAHAGATEREDLLGDVGIVRRTEEDHHIETKTVAGNRKQLEIAGMGSKDDKRSRIVAEIQEKRYPRYLNTTRRRTLRVEVEKAIEEEQRLRIEGVVSASVGEILDESGVEAKIVVRQGEAVKTVRDYIGHREEVAALVLGAAPSGNPGPLVANFCGNDAGKLPCPVMLIPGSLTDERLEQLS